MEDQKLRDELFQDLIDQITRMGYPKEFGYVIAKNLGTPKTLSRMIGYLYQAKPRSAEEIADEMLAIRADRDRWISKKQAEFYNMKYNELLWNGLGTEDEDDETLE